MPKSISMFDDQRESSTNVVEVADGVWRATAAMSVAPDGSAAITVNTYLVVDSGEGLIVDTAWWYGLEPNHLDALISAAGIEPGAIDKIVMTHAHRDHSGFVNYLEKITGAVPWLHAAEEASVAGMEGFDGLGTRDASINWYRSHGFPQTFAEFMVESRVKDTVIDLERAEWGKDSEIHRVGNRELEVILTPGHTNGHVCLYESSTGILFSGDALLPRGHGNPHVTCRPLSLFDPLTPYIDSISTFESRSIGMCLPGHGPPVQDVHGLISSQLDYVEAKLLMTEECLTSDGVTAFEIAQRMPWRKGRKSFDQLVNDELFLAFGDTLARLRRLVTTGRAIASDDSVVKYSTP